MREQTSEQTEGIIKGLWGGGGQHPCWEEVQWVVASWGTENILNAGTESAILIPQTLASVSCHLCPRAPGRSTRRR